MAARSVSVEDFDQLVASALNDINSRYQHNECSAEEKENIKIAAIERLPDDLKYEVHTFVATSKAKFKLCFASKDVTVDNIEGWLIEFQTMSNVTLKVKVKKKETKGYLLQNYYRCHYNTRNWSPSKDPQRELSLNPAARVKAPIAHFR